MTSCDQPEFENVSVNRLDSYKRKMTESATIQLISSAVPCQVLYRKTNPFSVQITWSYKGRQSKEVLMEQSQKYGSMQGHVLLHYRTLEVIIVWPVGSSDALRNQSIAFVSKKSDEQLNRDRSQHGIFKKF